MSQNRRISKVEKLSAGGVEEINFILTQGFIHILFNFVGSFSRDGGRRAPACSRDGIIK